MRLSDEAYEEIKQEVVHLLVQLKISSFPINGFDLAKRMNITLIRYSELSEEKLKIVQKLSPDGFFSQTQMVKNIFTTTMQEAINGAI